MFEWWQQYMVERDGIRMWNTAETGSIVEEIRRCHRVLRRKGQGRFR
jgi:hypothetical protein